MSRNAVRLSIVLSVLGLALAGCSNDPDGKGTDGGVALDAGMDGGETQDTGGVPDTNPPPSDMGEEPADLGMEDADTVDMAPMRRSLDDYRICDRDSDCPVGLGSCVKQVPLNRAAADGSTTISVAELFDEVADGEGICTRVCTDSPDTCSDLSFNGTDPDPVPYECQLIFVDGDAPYPDPPPAYPFDDQLDPGEQELGAAFGAICRPPFGLDPDVPDSICAMCRDGGDCDEQSTCWDFLNGEPTEDGAGTCVAGCDSDADCPMGFLCDLTDPTTNATYCRPIHDTCSNCRDLDGDLFGDGRCAPDGTVTDHDCDDFNADAYFDAADMEHPFPQFCGVQDFNCNGIDDTIEEVGVDAYPVQHCSACFDMCDGPVDNGTATCSNIDDGTGNGTTMPACTAECSRDANGVPTHADCNGLLSDGCEIAIDDATALYYVDADGDGFGDPSTATFVCPGDTPDPGLVQPADLANPVFDCEDDPAVGGADIYPGAPLLCDGLDNDCSDAPGGDSVEFPTLGGNCASRNPDGTRPMGACLLYGVFECAPDLTVQCSVTPGTPAAVELCDYVDGDCDGLSDKQDGFGNLGNFCSFADGCPLGTWVCGPGGGNTVCDPDPNGLPTEVWYRDVDGDGYGSDDPALAIDSCNTTPPAGYVDNNTDCDDGRDDVHPNITTGEPDNTLCMKDTDGDGWGDVDRGPQQLWQAGSDCDDDDALAFPFAEPFMNAPTQCMRDQDLDGWGDDSPTNLDVTPGTDCDDTLTTGPPINPDAVEICDVDANVVGIDNNCNAQVNEGCPASIGLDASADFDSVAQPSNPAITPDRTISLLCNNDEVLQGIDGIYDNFGHLHEFKLRCGNLDLKSSADDTILDEIATGGGATLTYVPPPDSADRTSYIGDCSSTQAIASYELETSVYGIAYLEPRCHDMGIDMPVSDDDASNPATVTLTGAQTFSLGQLTPDPEVVGACSDPEAVAYGVEFGAKRDFPAINVDSVITFKLKCRKIDLGVIQ